MKNRIIVLLSLFALLSTCCVEVFSAQKKNEGITYFYVETSPNSTLTIDGKKTSARYFVTPKLEIGKIFHYTFTSSFNKNGQLITISQKVTFKPGQKITITLLPEAQKTIQLPSYSIYRPYSINPAVPELSDGNTVYNGGG